MRLGVVRSLSVMREAMIAPLQPEVAVGKPAGERHDAGGVGLDRQSHQLHHDLHFIRRSAAEAAEALHFQLGLRLRPVEAKALADRFSFPGCEPNPDTRRTSPWSCLPSSRFTAFALSRTEVQNAAVTRFQTQPLLFPRIGGESSRNSLRYIAVASIEGTCTPVRVKLVWLLSFTFSVIDG